MAPLCNNEVVTGPRPSRFTVNLDPVDDARYERLVADLAGDIGRVPSSTPGRGRRFPSRADLLRAMLTVTEDDPDTLAAVRAQVRRDLLGPDAIAQLRDIAAEVHRIAPRLEGPDAQERAGKLADEIDALSERQDVMTARGEVSSALHSFVLRTERIGAVGGGYTYLRPMLELATRIAAVRNVVDPAPPRSMAPCPRCRLTTRRGPDGELERHNDQAGHPCEPTRT